LDFLYAGGKGKLSEILIHKNYSEFLRVWFKSRVINPFQITLDGHQVDVL
jgi:hypothetical protein